MPGNNSAGAADPPFHNGGKRGPLPIVPRHRRDGGESASVALGAATEAASRNSLGWGRALGGNGPAAHRLRGAWNGIGVNPGRLPEPVFLKHRW